MRNLVVFSLLLLTFSAASQSAVNSPADTVFPFRITLRTVDSVAISSQQALALNGKPTLLAFWLTTCYPCMIELEAYTKKYAAWQKESPFNLIAISTDFPQKFPKIAAIAHEKAFPFPVFWDANRIFRTVLPGELNGLPQVFLFDQQGQLVWHHKRFYTGLEDEMFEQVKLLNARAPKPKKRWFSNN